MSAAVLRPAQPGDLEEIQALYGGLYDVLRSFGLPYELEPEGLRELLAVYLRSSHCQLTVAEAEGRVVGFLSAGVVKMDRKLSYRGEGRMGYVHDLYVTPEYRGNGVARALLQRAEDWFRESGVCLAECSVVSGNEAGMAFWSRQGYGELGRTLYKPLSRQGK